ncbi:hypothetical protein ACHHRT_08065 [Desulfurivibrio sp. D14AmB]|uniref:hypothetical protein n=1 Tax=Desulfurivibrio sp. D14AmB TaxID=3374370 RepID=UPI00376F3A5F
MQPQLQAELDGPTGGVSGCSTPLTGLKLLTRIAQPVRASSTRRILRTAGSSWVKAEPPTQARNDSRR